MFTNHVYGIDLGSHMIKIFSQKSNKIMKERNMIAIRNQENVLAAGDAAYEMFEKTPDNVEVTSTMSNGMIANISYLEILLLSLLKKSEKKIGQHPVIYFSVPVDMTEIERRAYYSVAQTGPLRKSKVLLVERPIADALALGVPINKTKGSMIVNIGSATTEMSIIADSRVIISKIIPIGGDEMDLRILNTIRRKNNFLISSRTSSRLKIAMADLSDEKKIAKKIVGMDCVSGLPREKAVTSTTVNGSIMNSAIDIGMEIKTFLERTPPQIHRLVQKEGIFLTGGSSRIPNIAKVISEQVGCPILLSNYYDLCTIYGLKEIITHNALHHWAVTPKKRK